MKELKGQYVPVFLASTFSNLKEYRAAAWKTLEALKLAVHGMELFGARSPKPIQTCLEEVAKSKIFIGVIGMRRGSIDPDTGMSFVECEYNKAADLKLEILLYLIDEERARVAPKLVDTGDAAGQLHAFKEKLKQVHTVDFFESPEDLSSKIKRDLMRLLAKRGIAIDKDRMEPADEACEVVDLLNAFDLMPKRHAHSELEMIVAARGKPWAVDRSTCEALGVDFGHSVARRIRVIEPADVSKQFDFLRTVYAEYESCDILLDAPENEPFKALLRLQFGETSCLRGDTNPILASQGIWDPDSGRIYNCWVEHHSVKGLVLIRRLPD